VKLTTHLQLVPKSRKCGSIHPFPIRLQLYFTAHIKTSLPNFHLSTEFSRFHHLTTANSGTFNPILCCNCSNISLLSLLNHLLLQTPSILFQSMSKSKLLYDRKFTADQFVFASGPLRPTTTVFIQLNPCGHSPYVISSLTRRWDCLL
jgi:hypothetical protein